MKKNCRIRKRREFVNVAESGFYFRTNSLVIQCKPNKSNEIRTGFTASKKVGNAVCRNRCKRRMRALSNIVLSYVGQSGIDYVFIARRNMAAADWSELVEDATRAVSFLNKKALSVCGQS